jgi:hypothetical protein
MSIRLAAVSIYLIIPVYQILRGSLLYNKSGFSFYRTGSIIRMLAFLIPIGALPLTDLFNSKWFWVVVVTLVGGGTIASVMETQQISRLPQSSSPQWFQWQIARRQSKIMWKLLVLHEEPVEIFVTVTMFALILANSQGWIK